MLHNGNRLTDPRMNQEQRLTELETRLAFQDDALSQLNDVIIDQQRRLDRMFAQILQLQDRIKSLTPSNIAPPSEETPPPHY